MQAGDFVYFVCQQKDLGEILKHFGSETNVVKNVLIVGGGKIGCRLALELDDQNYNLKLIEMDAHRCQSIAGQLHRTMVLHGYATDQAFMQQENVGNMDLVIAVTADEEMNILSCMLAKRLGAKKTVARVNKLAYITLVHAIGIDQIISPRRFAIDSHHACTAAREKSSPRCSSRARKPKCWKPMALENSEIVGTPLKEFKFPKDALVLCLARGDEVIIPSGDTVIQPQDRVIILSTRKNIPRWSKSSWASGGSYDALENDLKHRGCAACLCRSEHGPAAWLFTVLPRRRHPAADRGHAGDGNGRNGLFYLIGQNASSTNPINHREGMAATTLCWVAAAKSRRAALLFGRRAACTGGLRLRDHLGIHHNRGFRD